MSQRAGKTTMKWVCLLVSGMAFSSAQAFVETFSYPDGQLTSASGGNWTANGGNPTDRIMAQGGVAQILSWGTVTGNNDAIRSVNVTPTPGGLITLDLDILGGLDGGNHWSIEFQSSLNNNIARWYGSETTALPRIGGKTVATGYGTAVTLGDAAWVKLRAVIDTVANVTNFYQDTGSGMQFNVAIPHDNAGDNDVDYVLLRSNNTQGDPPHVVSIDNISVVPEPTALALLALGGLFIGRRRHVG